MPRKCENCIHEEKCIEWLVETGASFVNAETCKHYAADVVPKSEVEKQKLEIWKQQGEIDRLTRICNSYALQYGTVTDQQKVIDKAKAEVIEEIEKEIDSVRGLNFALQSLAHFLAELKKKYTEGENDR